MVRAFGPARAVAAAVLLTAAVAVTQPERSRLFRREERAPDGRLAAERHSWLEDGNAQALHKDLTICTLVDGRGQSLSSDVEVAIPHLLETALPERTVEHLPSDAEEDGRQGVTVAVVLVDCEGVGGQEVLRRVAALHDELPKRPFRHACVDTSEKARSDWSELWLQEAPLEEKVWPKWYVSTLRLALHQCLRTECKTRHCAWSDGDNAMVPNFASGWARGTMKCLLAAEKETDQEEPPVFAVVSHVHAPRDKESLEAMRRDFGEGQQLKRPWSSFIEFSSQAFVVDRDRLFNSWLPIERAVWNYTDLKKFQKYDILLRPDPLNSAIERLVVAKSASEKSRCEAEGRNCAPVVECRPAPAYMLTSMKVTHSVHRGDAEGSLLTGLTKAFQELHEHGRRELYATHLQGLFAHNSDDTLDLPT